MFFFPQASLLAVFLLTWGVPIGMPPAKPDATLDRMAPDQVIFFTSSAGASQASSESTNHAEQFLANPEIRTFLEKLDQNLEKVLEIGMRGDAIPSKAAALSLRLSMQQPWMFYLSEITRSPDGRPQIRAGYIAKLGALKEQVANLLEKVGASGQLKIIGGHNFHEFSMDDDAVVTIGIHGDYLMIGLGGAEIPSILIRKQSEAPAWLPQLRDRFPIDRKATVSKLNIANMLAAGGRFPITTIAEPVIRLLDLRNMECLDAASGLDKTGCVQLAALDLKGPPGGLLARLTSPALTNKDLAAIPEDATVSTAFRIDLSDIVKQVERAAAAANAPTEDGFEAIEKIIGMRVREDFLAALGKVITVHTSPRDGGLLAGWTATIPVEDRGKVQLGLALERIRQAVEASRRGNNRARAFHQFKFKGQDIYSLPVDGFVVPTISYCVTETHLIVSLFPQAIKSFLESQASQRPTLADHPQAKIRMEETPAPFALVKLDNKRLIEDLYPWVHLGWHSVQREMLRHEEVEFDFDILPSVSALTRHAGDSVTTARLTKSGIEFEQRQNLPTLSASRMWLLAAMAFLGIG